MTLDDLSQAWNDLRNAALGRGVKPIVAEPLASQVGNAYERWRQYLASAGPSQDLVPSATAWPWLQQYRELASKVSAAGVQFQALPVQPLEQASSFYGDTVRTVAIAVGAIALPLVALILLRKRG